MSTPHSARLQDGAFLLESLELLPTGKQVKGAVKVLNLGFQKEVVARFTFDGRKTVSEVAAEHGKSLCSGHSTVSHRFYFLIDLERSQLEPVKVMRLCICYNMLDKEYWQQ